MKLDNPDDYNKAAGIIAEYLEIPRIELRHVSKDITIVHAFAKLIGKIEELEKRVENLESLNS